MTSYSVSHDDADSPHSPPPHPGQVQRYEAEKKRLRIVAAHQVWVSALLRDSCQRAAGVEEGLERQE